VTRVSVLSAFETDRGVDFSYAGADPGKQAIPSSWPRDLSGLNTKIYESVHPYPAYT
jgi:hypothetical protein